MTKEYLSKISGVVNGPDVRKLLKSASFEGVLSDVEAIAWDSIKALIEGFFGNHRVDGYEIFVQNLLESFQNLGVSMSLKIHFLHHHLDFFTKQLASESDEQGERFHQTIMPMEKRYKGKKLDALLGEVCWWSQVMYKHQPGDEEEGETETGEPLNDFSDSDSDNGTEPPPKKSR